MTTHTTLQAALFMITFYAAQEIRCGLRRVAGAWIVIPRRATNVL